MTPWIVPCQPPLSNGILQARALEWVAVRLSRESSQPRNRTGVSWTADGFFTSRPTREAPRSCYLPTKRSADCALHNTTDKGQRPGFRPNWKLISYYSSLWAFGFTHRGSFLVVSGKQQCHALFKGSPDIHMACFLAYLGLCSNSAFLEACLTTWSPIFSTQSFLIIVS